LQLTGNWIVKGLAALLIQILNLTQIGIGFMNRNKDSAFKWNVFEILSLQAAENDNECKCEIEKRF
jgi:hypothetical protein